MPSWVMPRCTGTPSSGTSEKRTVLFWPRPMASPRSRPTLSASTSKAAENSMSRDVVAAEIDVHQPGHELVAAWRRGSSARPGRAPRRSYRRRRRRRAPCRSPSCVRWIVAASAMANPPVELLAYMIDPLQDREPRSAPPAGTSHRAATRGRRTSSATATSTIRSARSRCRSPGAGRCPMRCTCLAALSRRHGRAAGQSCTQATRGGGFAMADGPRRTDPTDTRRTGQGARRRRPRRQLRLGARQGVHYYRDAKPDEFIPVSCTSTSAEYHISTSSSRRRSTCDTDKVGRDLGEAIGRGQNNTVRFSRRSGCRCMAA